MEYKIYITKEFKKDFNKCDFSIKKQIQKGINQLKENPYIGKPLNYRFFREKKIQNYRIYYIIYEEYIVIFVIALSTKKDQQTIIDKIKRLFPFYREEIKKKFSQ